MGLEPIQYRVAVCSRSQFEYPVLILKMVVGFEPTNNANAMFLKERSLSPLEYTINDSRGNWTLHFVGESDMSLPLDDRALTILLLDSIETNLT